MDIIPQPTTFLWDKGNEQKNWLKHGVSVRECEEVILSDKTLYFEDPKHSMFESRYVGFGYTASQRLLSIVFTIRRNAIRIISARDASRKEKRIYEEAFKNT
jgi:uncharacterized protein